MSANRFTIDGATFVNEAEYARRCNAAMRRDPTLTKEGAHELVIARAKEWERDSAAMRAAHEDARSRGLGTGKGGTGSVACPKCGTGTISYGVSSYNGHMRGFCSTPKCLAWME